MFHVYEQMGRLSKLNRCSAGLQIHLVNERNVPLAKATLRKLLIFLLHAWVQVQVSFFPLIFLHEISIGAMAILSVFS
jgi:hypothetical protein